MNNEEWQIICKFRENFKKKIEEWVNFCKKNQIDLIKLQKNAAEKTKTPAYSFETPIVYNSDLEKITKDDEIALIVIGDNPGKEEQLLKNRKYLCGQAGKLAEGFFRKNAELGIDFRKNVIILNKTPVHSAKTAQLSLMMKEGGEKVEQLILESQLWMAEETAKLHKALFLQNKKTELWIAGYSELKNKGFFVPYKTRLKEEYDEKTWDKVYVFQHFSMNRFTIDLREHYDEQKTLEQNIRAVGKLHKNEIFN